MTRLSRRGTVFLWRLPLAKAVFLSLLHAASSGVLSFSERSLSGASTFIPSMVCGLLYLLILCVPRGSPSCSHCCEFLFAGGRTGLKACCFMRQALWFFLFLNAVWVALPRSFHPWCVASCTSSSCAFHGAPPPALIAVSSCLQAAVLV